MTAEDLIDQYLEMKGGVHPDDVAVVRGDRPYRRKPKLRGDQSRPTASMTVQEPPKDWINFSGATQGAGNVR